VNALRNEKCLLPGPNKKPPEGGLCDDNLKQPFLLSRSRNRSSRRLARDSTDPMLQISLRRLADEYTTRADEREDEEIALGMDP
jgi:hypothetical protein